MKVNWLWDTRLNEQEVRNILKDPGNPRFPIYAGKLISRVQKPEVVFSFIKQADFCRKWPVIRKRLEKDAWSKDKIAFWQTQYSRERELLQEQGISLRVRREAGDIPERINIAQLLKKQRQQSGYTQGELAKKLGVIQQYISKVESGRENVCIGTLKRFAEVFHKQLIFEMK